MVISLPDQIPPRASPSPIAGAVPDNDLGDERIATASARFQTQLRSLRERRRESLRDVARAVGISKTHLWALETQERPNPGFRLLLNLREHFGVSMSELFGDTPVEDWRSEMRNAVRYLPPERGAVILEIAGIRPNTALGFGAGNPEALPDAAPELTTR
jgi:transcriptional regulator with XRE-family HTH domain